MAPEAYGINLNPIANEPYFEMVEIKQSMDLSRVAALAEIDEDEMFQLNPAYKQRATTDGPQHLLVPTSKAQLLTASLSNLKPEELVSLRPKKAVFDTVASTTPRLKRTYKVKSGDNLTTIAKANRVNVRDLQRWNKLTGKNLKAGQMLVMQDTRKPATRQKPTQYKVKKGDSLYIVAKRFNVEMQHLKRWNPNSAKALKPGQMLTISKPR
jgi:membrane-bound lytic murein transglycosylase D